MHALYYGILSYHRLLRSECSSEHRLFADPGQPSRNCTLPWFSHRLCPGFLLNNSYRAIKALHVLPDPFHHTTRSILLAFIHSSRCLPGTIAYWILLRQLSGYHHGTSGQSSGNRRSLCRNCRGTSLYHTDDGSNNTALTGACSDRRRQLHTFIPACRTLSCPCRFGHTDLFPSEEKKIKKKKRTDSFVLFFFFIFFQFQSAERKSRNDPIFQLSQRHSRNLFLNKFFKIPAGPAAKVP